jgi:ribonuclease HI
LAKAHARPLHPKVAPLRSGFVALHADGGAREGLRIAAIGYELRGADGTVHAMHSERIGNATAVVAEYRALLAGLERAHRLGLDRIDARSDARLVVQHLRCERELRNPKLESLRAEILELATRIGTVVFTWIPSDANGEAHALVAEALAHTHRSRRA